MKLELDINSPQNSSLNHHSASTNGSGSEEVKKMLRLGIGFAKEGNRAEARQMLLNVTEADHDNETAWLWLASISEYPEELLVFLQNVLKINPENERALEWAKQTKSLLSKTFVQRGINASQNNQKEFAKQCFLQGIVHDSENEMAWLWLASSSDSQEEKLSHLQKVLQINPHNETASSSLSAVKNQMSQALLKKANSAAVAGDHVTARQTLETIMKNTPNLEEAWILKAFLASDFYEKIECYEKALEINPECEAAQAGLSSLKSLMQKVTKPLVEVSQPEAVTEEKAVVEEVAKQEEVTNFEETEEVSLLDDSHETVDLEVEEAQQPVQELAHEVTVEEFAQSLSYHENQPAAVEQHVVEETVAQVERQAVVEEVQPQMQNEVLAEEAQVEKQVASIFETIQIQPVQEQPFAEEEILGAENQVEPDLEFAEPADNPTQELDEEFAHHAEKSFNSSFEDIVEEFQEVQPQEAEVRNEVIESVFAPANEFKVAEQPEVVAETKVKEFPSVEAAPPEDVLRSEFVEETVAVQESQQVEETAPAAFQSPYSSNGFGMVSQDEPFADYQQPTVEFSYSEVAQAEESPVEKVEEIAVQEAQTVGLVEEVNEFQANVSAEFAEPQAVVSEEVEPALAEETAKLEETETVDYSQPQIHQSQLAQCPFCAFENETQAVVCGSCQSMLSLSDLEMLLAHQGADQDLLLKAIERIEVERSWRDFSAEELSILGIAHLNAKNLRKGFTYLQEASALNPNDVVLSSKVNFLAIRLSEIEEHDTKAQENPVQSRTILVVDDSPTVRKLISGKLEKCGHSVLSAVDGMDALAKINEVIPDLILLDITMPRLDGYQVCKLIRNNEMTKDIPVVMISGKDGFFDKVRGRMAGSTGYITKPFGPDTLMKTIETYLT